MVSDGSSFGSSTGSKSSSSASDDSPSIVIFASYKYYGAEKGPALWAGKALALLLTCGYRPERGCDLFEEGMRRYCKHAQLRFLGSHAERHLGYDVPFMDAEKEARTRAFARELWDAVH